MRCEKFRSTPVALDNLCGYQTLEDRSERNPGSRRQFQIRLNIVRNIRFYGDQEFSLADLSTGLGWNKYNNTGALTKTEDISWFTHAKLFPEPTRPDPHLSESFFLVTLRLAVLNEWTGIRLEFLWGACRSNGKLSTGRLPTTFLGYGPCFTERYQSWIWDKYTLAGTKHGDR